MEPLQSLIKQVCHDLDNIDHEALMNIIVSLNKDPYDYEFKEDKKICKEILKDYIQTIVIISPYQKENELIEMHKKGKVSNINWIKAPKKWNCGFDIFINDCGGGGDCMFHAIATGLRLGGHHAFDFIKKNGEFVSTENPLPVTMPYMRLLASQGIRESYTEEFLRDIHGIEKDALVLKNLTLGIDGDDYSLAGIVNTYNGQLGVIVLRDVGMGPKKLHPDDGIAFHPFFDESGGNTPTNYIIIYHQTTSGSSDDRSGHYLLAGIKKDKKYFTLFNENVLNEIGISMSLYNFAAIFRNCVEKK